MTRATASLPLAAALAAALLLSTAPPALAAREAAPVAVDAAFKPAEQAREIVELTGSSVLKNVKRVAVTQFHVQFQTSASQAAETSGFGMAGRASVNATYNLVGVGESDFQALAEALHARFLDELRAAGYDVVPAAEVAASPTWRKLAAGGTPLPERGEAHVTVAPPGMAMFGVSRMGSTQGKGSGVFGALSGIGSSFAALGQIGDYAPLRNELGDAALLEVSMSVQFAQLTNENKGFLGRLSDTAAVSGKVQPMVREARLIVTDAAGSTTVALKPALALDGSAFATVREKPKSTGETAGAVAAGLLRMAIGNKDTASFTTYEAVAEPARWREVVGSGLGSAGSVMIERMKAER